MCNNQLNYYEKIMSSEIFFVKNLSVTMEETEYKNLVNCLNKSYYLSLNSLFIKTIRLHEVSLLVKSKSCKLE